MDSIQYKRTEGDLYRYFRKKKRLQRIEYELEILKQSIFQIKDELLEVRVELSDNTKSIDYSKDRVLCSDTTSAVEKELMRITQKLDDELIRKINKRYKLKTRLREIREDVKRIENILADLTDEEMQIVELRYAEGYNNIKISRIMHCGESTIRRKKDKIVEFIFNETRD